MLTPEGAPSPPPAAAAEVAANPPATRREETRRDEEEEVRWGVGFGDFIGGWMEKDAVKRVRPWFPLTRRRRGWMV